LQRGVPPESSARCSTPARQALRDARARLEKLTDAKKALKAARLERSHLVETVVDDLKQLRADLEADDDRAHHHPYELAPTSQELRAWLWVVRDVIRKVDVHNNDLSQSAPMR